MRTCGTCFEKLLFWSVLRCENVRIRSNNNPGPHSSSRYVPKPGTSLVISAFISFFRCALFNFNAFLHTYMRSHAPTAFRHMNAVYVRNVHLKIFAQQSQLAILISVPRTPSLRQKCINLRARKNSGQTAANLRDNLSIMRRVIN